MLWIKTFKWGDKYSVEDVHKVAAGFGRHLAEPHRFECITDDAKQLNTEHSMLRDPELCKIKGCFARLRLFDPEYQAELGVKHGDRIVCVDLDVVITGPLFSLFHRPEPFLIVSGANAANPCPYNGSMWMLRAGFRPDIWQEFSLEAASRLPYYEFPDDQGWLAHHIPGVDNWRVGNTSGIYAFQKPGWPKGNDLPSDARIVVFPGWRSPRAFKNLPWIRTHWRL